MFRISISQHKGILKTPGKQKQISNNKVEFLDDKKGKYILVDILDMVKRYHIEWTYLIMIKIVYSGFYSSIVLCIIYQRGLIVICFQWWTTIICYHRQAEQTFFSMCTHWVIMGLFCYSYIKWSIILLDPHPLYPNMSVTQPVCLSNLTAISAS